MKQILKTFVFIVLIPILCGWAAGRLVGIAIQNSMEKKEVKEVVQSLDDFSKRAADLKKDYDIAATTPAEYIIKSYALFEMIYEFTMDKRLLYTHQEQFYRSCYLMHDIYDSQQKASQDVDMFTVADVGSVFVVEMEKYSHLMEALTVVTYEETLKMDPGNQQALDTLNKIYNKDQNEE